MRSQQPTAKRFMKSSSKFALFRIASVIYARSREKTKGSGRRNGNFGGKGKPGPAAASVTDPPARISAEEFVQFAVGVADRTEAARQRARRIARHVQEVAEQKKEKL